MESHLPPEWLGAIAEVKQLVQELPARGDKHLVELRRQIPESRQERREEPHTPLDQMRRLLARMMEDWVKYWVFDWQAEAPGPTPAHTTGAGNGTERASGIMKM